MPAESSRYFEIEIATLVLPDGREVKYLERRFSPPPTGPTADIVEGGKRLDLLAHEHLGDPQQFWRLCDFNRTLDPLELEDPQVRVRIPGIPGTPGGSA